MIIFRYTKVFVSLSLQVDFGSLRRVTRVATQGSSGTVFPFYVKSFQFKYSNNSLEWTEYSENGIAKVNASERRRKWRIMKSLDSELEHQDPSRIVEIFISCPFQPMGSSLSVDWTISQMYVFLYNIRRKTIMTPGSTFDCNWNVVEILMTNSLAFPLAVWACILQGVEWTLKKGLPISRLDRVKHVLYVFLLEKFECKT